MICFILKKIVTINHSSLLCIQKTRGEEKKGSINSFQQSNKERISSTGK